MLILRPLEWYCKPHSLAECCLGQLSAVALPSLNPPPGPVTVPAGPITEALDGSLLVSQTGG